MSFGEHLEELRDRIIKSLFGLVIGTVVGLFFGSEILAFVTEPLDRALREFQYETIADGLGETPKEDLGDWVWRQLGLKTIDLPEEEEVQDTAEKLRTVDVEISGTAFAEALRVVAPELPLADASTLDETSVTLPIANEAFGRFRVAADQNVKPVTHGVQEAFMTYVKVSVITGAFLSSPWIVYQIWLFVAAGLYPHERGWVKRYGWISLLLFFGGAIFCWYIVLSFYLTFMLGFNRLLDVPPNIQLTTWIGQATFLPLVFGISFQLPLVMLFLQRIDVFETKDYVEKWRIAVFAIAVLSMLLTPTDPTSMLAMMVPLCLLYVLGIKLCEWAPPVTPFDDAVTAHLVDKREPVESR